MQRPSDIARWHEYALTGRMDWESLFDRYRSCVDFPASCAWRELTTTTDARLSSPPAIRPMVEEHGHHIYR